ncbi:MAG: hypothetical protein HOI57_01290 [Rhodospirillaceae bacterium]|jgi:hypothetical protein|nr:hypothetical protein [Rhodospirillaceae bacterium]MBT4771650.1 hypothetical protein [Rhodospirillaceae bacterium]MBT5768019.1 hypothetical protein [Rhodospirillaceae bacterium]MBT6310340.1 hypothetical protein [Rhodospirillaceae bacterium]MBT7365418.1 hypothetical protein [Rhodospirillaceae bacterium]
MHFSIISTQHPDRARAESGIEDVYQRRYGCSVPSFAPHLAVLSGADGNVLCAAGVRLGGEQFFSESYFDTPAETLAARALGRPVDRFEIVEISTLAAVRSCAAGPFLSQLVNRTRELGTSMLLFTATGRLRTYLQRNGVSLIELCPADPARLSGQDGWGTYFDHDPVVCLSPDTVARPFTLAPPASLAGQRLRVAA